MNSVVRYCNSNIFISPIKIIDCSGNIYFVDKCCYINTNGIVKTLNPDIVNQYDDFCFVYKKNQEIIGFTPEMLSELFKYDCNFIIDVGTYHNIIYFRKIFRNNELLYSYSVEDHQFMIPKNRTFYDIMWPWNDKIVYKVYINVPKINEMFKNNQCLLNTRSKANIIFKFYD
jgi:hypothetical protein